MILAPVRTAALAAIALLSLFALPAPENAARAQTPDPDGAGSLTLLHNNDGESALLPLTNSVGTDDGDIDVPVGGIAAFATLSAQQRAEAEAAGNAVLNVYAGDAYLPSATLVCTRLEGNPFYDAIAQSLVDYDAHVFGNHDFDYGPDFLETFIRALADQPFLSANLDFAAEAGFADLVDADGLIELPAGDGRVIGRSVVLTDPATGQRFGLVGATTPALASISSPGEVSVTPDLATTAAAVQAEIDRLYDGLGVRKIILVSHLQSVATDAELIALLSRVDIAVGGGGDELLQNPDIAAELQLLPGEQAEAVGTYPIEASDADGRTVYVVTTAAKYAYLGRIDVVFDTEGEIAGVVTETSYPRPVVPESEAATAVGFAGTVAPDAGVTETVIAPLEECLTSLATTPVGETEVLLDVSRVGSRTSETNAGNLITDAYLWVYDNEAAELGLEPRGAGNPVVAIQNGGGILQNAGDVLPRDGTVPGEIHALDTLDILPFDSFVTIVEDVTAADLQAIFERSVASIGPSLPDAGGQFLQVAGLRVVYDLSQPVGSRVVSLELEDGTPIIADGEVVAAEATVIVVTINFIAAGGDGYDALAANPARTQLPLTYEEALRLYLGELGTVSADDPRYQPGGEGRITFEAQQPEPTPTATAELETPTVTPEPTAPAPAATPTPAQPDATATAPAPSATPTRVAPAPPDSGSGPGDSSGRNAGLLVIAVLVLACGGATALAGRRQRRR